MARGLDDRTLIMWAVIGLTVAGLLKLYSYKYGVCVSVAPVHFIGLFTFTILLYCNEQSVMAHRE